MQAHDQICADAPGAWMLVSTGPQARIVEFTLLQPPRQVTLFGCRAAEMQRQRLIDCSEVKASAARTHAARRQQKRITDERPGTKQSIIDKPDYRGAG